MTTVQITDVVVTAGVMTGRILCAEPLPPIEARYGDQQLPGLTLDVEDGEVVLRLPLPPQVLSDGVQTVILCNPGTGTAYYALTIRCGIMEPGDLVQEVALLRAELDLLKSAFRRQCAATDTP